MTPAERKAASRATQKAKQDDAERRNLIADILKIVRRNLAGPGDVGRYGVVAANRKYIRVLHDDLFYLSVNKLQMSLEALKIPDSRGRLHNERSGEKNRSMGQSEIETIVAAMQHDSSLIDDDSQQDPTLARGFQVTPPGHGPDSDETDDADSTGVRSGTAKPQLTLSANEKWLKETISRIVGKMNFDTDSTKCPFCFDVFLTPVGAEGHLEDQYVRGQKDIERLQEYTADMSTLNSHPSMPGEGIAVAVEPNTKAYWHFKTINREIESVRKQSRKKPEGNFVTLRPAA